MKNFGALFNDVATEVDKALGDHYSRNPHKRKLTGLNRRRRAEEITRRALKRIWVQSAMLDRDFDQD